MSARNVESTTAARELAQAHALIAELERRLDALNVRLIDAEHCKSHFISHALNELNNPLAAIVGLAEQCIDMQEPAWDQVRQSLQWVRDEGNYLEFQLRNLFMAGQLESGVARMNRSRVDVHNVLNAVTMRYLALAQRKGVVIQCNGGHALLSVAGANRYLNSDGAVLGLIYANLLDNAVKFSTAGGIVHVSVDSTLLGLDLAVDSDGPRIPEVDRTHLFDRFMQVDDSTTRLYRGLGLGLSVAGSCAELLGGRLALSPQDQERTCFILHLPSIGEDQLTDASEANVFLFQASDSDSDTDDERF